VQEKLKQLNGYLKKAGLSVAAERVSRILKIGSMPGVDSPAEEMDIEGVNNAITYIEENPGKFIFLDNPEGTKKRFGQKLKKIMPFHYGEFTELTNPADDMGWDIIVVPSAQVETKEVGSTEDERYIPAGHSLVPVGYVPVNDSQEDWTKHTKTPSRPEGKPAPVGNDKIILAPSEGWSDKDEDKRIIEEFFDHMWNFKDIIWL
jgi:hypothetical protein